jgi:two-component system alkaline phosphatase synthesis response regulator PhoP
MISVLVIDDSDMVCELTKYVLTMNGYQVVTTTDSREGLRLISDTTEPTVVFLNLTMPDPDGIAILEQLRTTPEVRQRHAIILFSASSRLEAVARQYAVEGILAKPAKPSQILAVLAMAEQSLQARASTR